VASPLSPLLVDVDGGMDFIQRPIYESPKDCVKRLSPELADASECLFYVCRGYYVTWCGRVFPRLEASLGPAFWASGALSVAAGSYGLINIL
jgi:hypothetical protein